jgi:hypothetical protein
MERDEELTVVEEQVTGKCMEISHVENIHEISRIGE